MRRAQELEGGHKFVNLADTFRDKFPFVYTWFSVSCFFFCTSTHQVAKQSQAEIIVNIRSFAKNFCKRDPSTGALFRYAAFASSRTQFNPVISPERLCKLLLHELEHAPGVGALAPVEVDDGAHPVGRGHHLRVRCLLALLAAGLEGVLRVAGGTDLAMYSVQ